MGKIKETSCYIINFYLGSRRKTISNYDKDRLCFLKKQIETLYQYTHSLDKIVFNFNIRDKDYKYVSDIFKLIPKFIQGVSVDVNFRDNQGMSYAAWVENFNKYKTKYDYFIFNEDDYFFVEDNWDQYLINKYNSYPDCGYLCPVIREPHHWNNYRKHAGHSTGIASTKNILKLKNGFPSFDSMDYSLAEEIQKQFTFCFIEVGLNVYDIRDDYRVAFGWTEDDYDIWRFFWWNKKDLIQPAFLMFNEHYNYFDLVEGECVKGYKTTTVDEALKCYNDKKTYYGEYR